MMKLFPRDERAIQNSLLFRRKVAAGEVLGREVQGRATWGMSIGLAAALFVLLLLKHHPVGQRFEFDSLDVWFNLREGTSSRRVSIVAIDEPTMRAWKGRPFNGRDVALVLRRLKKAGAIEVSMALPSLCGSRASGGSILTADDVAAMGPAMRETGFVFLPLLARSQADSSAGALLSAANVARWGSKMPVDLSAREFPPVRGVEAPPQSWLGAAGGMGHTAFGLDADGRPRLAWSALPWDNRLFPSLAMSVAARQRGAAWARELSESAQPLLLDFSPLDAPQPNAPPTKRDAGSLLRARVSTSAPASTWGGHGFPRVSLLSILRDERAAQVLAGQHVILCLSARELAPTYFAPDGRRVLEGELHAVALDNLII